MAVKLATSVAAYIDAIPTLSTEELQTDLQILNGGATRRNPFTKEMARAVLRELLARSANQC